MEIIISKSDIHDQDNRDSLKSRNEDEEITKIITFSSRKDNTIEICTREPFVRYMQRFDRRIPKNIITVDEKYLRRCLDLVYASALRGTSSRYGYDLSEFINYFPLEIGINWHETMGTITSKDNTNFLKHPLFRQSVITENDIVDGRDNLIDIGTISTSSRLERNISIFESNKFNIESDHMQHVSDLSTSTVSHHLYISRLGDRYRGTLHCNLKAGFPRYVFSLDECNEVYIANLIKSDTDDSFEYLYTFYTNKSRLVGRMRVSTSFKLCRNKMEIKETEFVLFGEEERDEGNTCTSISHNLKKHKGLSKKMSKILKTSHTSRERAANEKPLFNLITDFSINLELASVIVKEHVCMNRREPEVAGWGMKFLKKPELENTNASFTTCDYLLENKIDHISKSTHIIIPADFHGGSRNGNGGPSSLVERWRGERKCDCGGWDVGCPITVLDTERNEGINSSQIDIRISGTRDSESMMKMISIRDGLYVVDFLSNLSALQSFAIAVSIIHSQTVR